MIIYKSVGMFFNRILMPFNAFKGFSTDYSIGQNENALLLSSFIFPNRLTIFHYIVNFIKIFYWIYGGHK